MSIVGIKLNDNMFYLIIIEYELPAADKDVYIITESKDEAFRWMLREILTDNYNRIKDWIIKEATIDEHGEVLRSNIYPSEFIDYLIKEHKGLLKKLPKE
jgi:hypothetical protein